MKKQLLIDGDILLYRFAHSNEYSIEWEEGVHSRVVSGEEAIADLERFINDIQENTGAVSKAPIIVFSGKNNFRYTVLPTYKHNRAGNVKPELYQHLKDYLRENYVWKEIEGLEGDDVMGIMATKNPGKYIIASIDKDMMQIPGSHYNWNHDESREVEEYEGDITFYTQVLTGDPTDGYAGIPGIGPKKAEKILQEGISEGWTVWGTICLAYEAAGLTEADALQQARVARILRHTDYDFKNKQVILWTP